MFALISSAFLTLTGCAATPTSEPSKSEPVQAHLVALDNAHKAQLEGIIGDWFGGLKITLSDKAFIEASQITIERKALVDERHLPLEGRHNNPAFSFTMLKHGEQCLLRNDRSGEMRLLTDINCVKAVDDTML
ncbi:hypothetical protein D210916BOD24_12890 [Alteromonas sp. D210916BOD_24]